MLQQTPGIPVNDTEKALVLHSSAFRLNQAPPAPPPASAGVEFDLLDSLQRHWLLSLALFALITGLGSFWAIKTMRPVYQAEATIFVAPELAKDDMNGGAGTPYPTFVNQQIMSILHYNTLSAALHELSKKGVQWRLKGETEREAVDRLRSSLDVVRVPDSYEVAIQMTSGDPRQAATFANAVAQNFLNEEDRPDASGSRDRRIALEAEKATLEKDLRDELDKRAKLAESLQVVNLQKATTLPDDEVLFQMRQALVAAHRKTVEADEAVEAGQSTVASDAAQIASEDPTARSMTMNLLQRKWDLMEKIKTMLPTHPIRKEAEAEIAAIDAQLKAGAGANVPRVTEELMAKLRAKAAEAQRVEADLDAEIERQSSTIPAQARNLSQAEFVGGNIMRIQERLARVESEIEDMNLRAASGGTMRIFSLAQPPGAPVKSQRTKALAIVFAAATLLGIGLPVLLDLTDKRIYDPATIEQTLGFPVVGMTIARSTKTEHFADEHLRRLVAGIERGIAEGARSVLLVGIKEAVPAALMRDISGQLADRKMNVTVTPGRRKAEPEMRQSHRKSRIIGPGAPAGPGLPDIEEMEDVNVLLMDAPALVFSAEAERLAAEADMTLVVVQAGKNTREELVRGARLLEQLNVPAVGVILQDVQVSRAGRRLRRDLAEYTVSQRQLPGFTATWVA